MDGMIDARLQLEALAEFLTWGPAQGVDPSTSLSGLYSDLRWLALRHGDPPARPLTPPETGTLIDSIRALASRLGCEDRPCFYMEAARLIRRLLVEASNAAELSGTDSLEKQWCVPTGKIVVDFRKIDLALSQLGHRLPLTERIVELHYFAGLNETQLAEVLKITTATVAQELRFARAWLLVRLQQ